MGTERIRVTQTPVETVHAQIVDTETSFTDEVVSIGSAPNNDLVLDDATVSRYHVEVRRHERGIRVIDLGSTNRVFCQDVEIENAIVAPGSVLTLGNTKVRVRDGEPSVANIADAEDVAGIRGQSEAMRRLMAAVHDVARSPAPVLITGESGVGKELVAHAIHELASDEERPFVVVDCGGISPSLIASELFGHERGAFTGATRRHEGAFEQAHGGTLFLDEIGELPLQMQPKLLGVLERRTFRRVGGNEEIHSEVRVVAATHRDLRAEVNEGRFRHDLYHRLAVLELRVPPLRERPEDVPVLLDHFLTRAGRANERDHLFGPDVMKRLLGYAWPGNVRELRNVVDAAVALGSAPPLEETAPSSEAASSFEPFLELAYGDARDGVMREFQRHYLRHLLDRTEGNVSEASRLAKMDRSYLTVLMRKLGVRR